MSRIQTAENRQAILELVKSLHGLDHKLEKLANELRKEIYETRYFIEMYLKHQLDGCYQSACQEHSEGTCR